MITGPKTSTKYFPFGQYRRRGSPAHVLIFFLILIPWLCTCRSEETAGTVVVYTSVDQVYSEPVLRRFEQETNIKVLPVFDVEATKTAGLVNRLLAEKDNPKADVYWSGEFAHTLLLKDRGVLASYRSPKRSDIPDRYLDPEGYWTGFAGRARVFLVNSGLLSPEQYPSSLFDLLEERWPPEKVGIAQPLFGTTTTHASAIYAALGPQRAGEFFQRVHGRGLQVLDGNSVVKDLVANGNLWFGLTDTDDACRAVEEGAPVAIVLPDQDEKGLGTLIIPNTVALVANGPHPVEGKAVIDFLLDIAVERELTAAGWSHIPLREVAVESRCFIKTPVRSMELGLAEIYESLAPAKRDLTEIFNQ